jgi:arylsulfatase A-like enzyme
MTPSVLNPQPFSEMNALEQLTIVDGYHRLLLRDMVLNGLLRKLPNDTLLTLKIRGHIGFDLRDEVPQILSDTQADHKDPLFVYTQPQNLHPITLHEIAERGEKPQGDYPGFNARYADELRKVDEAFGQLIDGLKAQGQYDNSIVILTADHGDWLGEYGRWGHGQFLLAPILEVPLLIHLPPNLARCSYADTNQTVFLTDIAPSLLYLTGHRSLRKGEFFGRPLFTEQADEQKDYSRRFHLFMSSYAPIFGMLDEQTQTLYMADAVDDNQSLYNFAEDPYGLNNMIDKQSQAQFEQLLHASIERLNALYGYQSR